MDIAELQNEEACLPDAADGNVAALGGRVGRPVVPLRSRRFSPRADGAAYINRPERNRRDVIVLFPLSDHAAVSTSPEKLVASAHTEHPNAAVAPAAPT